MFNKIKFFFSFFADIYKNKNVLLSLIINDIKKQYLGSFLGIAWAFINPLVTICVMWFVFQFGFKSSGIKGVPFVLWLSAGMIPWFFMNDAIIKGTNSIVENSFLIKKILFRASLLPLVKVMASFFIHLFFILFLIIMFFIYGYMPTIYLLQIPYYVLCAISFTLSISYITSSINVFFRDTNQMTSVALQLFFWATPIFWSTNMIPERFMWIVKINPFYYIIEGYRNTFIYHVWFWETYKITPYFIGVTSILLLIGIFVFKKLRPHFADVV